MIPRKPAPDAIRGGYRSSEKIVQTISWPENVDEFHPDGRLDRRDRDRRDHSVVRRRSSDDDAREYEAGRQEPDRADRDPRRPVDVRGPADARGDSGRAAADNTVTGGPIPSNR